MNRPKSLFLTDSNLGAATDLYQLTMAAGLHKYGMDDWATFELWVRGMPEKRSFFVAAGLEQALHYILNLGFSKESVDYIKGLPVFSNVEGAFFKYLEGFKFSGDIFAAPEGSVFFGDEPVLRVSAPLIECQVMETYLLSTLGFQSLIASKAARVALAAQGKSVIDFGTRRAHGAQAGVLAARAGYIGGCAGTSNVLAGCELGLPVMGTMAHSWVMAVGDEEEAFKKFDNVFPDDSVLLIDTYDTINGARLAAKINEKLKGVRLDSGDLVKLSKETRAILDNEGLMNAKIVVSGDLNEHKIKHLLDEGAPVDVFGVGTEMVVSKDCPSLGCVYKLVEQVVDGQTIPKIKLSRDKSTYPFKKQIYRVVNSKGKFVGDVIGLANERFDPNDANFQSQFSNAMDISKQAGGQSGLKIKTLLEPVIAGGKICVDLPGISDIQQTARENIAALPEFCKKLDNNKPYTVAKSNTLEREKEKAVENLTRVSKK